MTHELAEDREQYFQEVIAALAAYLKDGGAMSLESTRDDVQQLSITFLIQDADEYQAILERLTRSAPPSPE